MKAYWRYFKYVCKHKWYVLLECTKMGIPFLGLIHDWSKFLPSEFFPYAKYFYKAGYVNKREFDFAWFLHQKRNKHHWQWWLYPKETGRIEALWMPYAYQKEMLCDWHGAGLAIMDRRNTAEWYELNKKGMILHWYVKQWIESQLYSEQEVQVNGRTDCDTLDECGRQHEA